MGSKKEFLLNSLPGGFVWIKGVTYYFENYLSCRVSRLIRSQRNKRRHKVFHFGTTFNLVTEILRYPGSLVTGNYFGKHVIIGK